MSARDAIRAREDAKKPTPTLKATKGTVPPLKSAKRKGHKK